MKKILLILFGFITLGLINFSSAFSENDIPDSAIIYTGSVDFDYSSSDSHNMYLFESLNYGGSNLPFSYYCAYFYNIDSGSLVSNAWLSFGFGPSSVPSGRYVARSYSYYLPNSSYIIDPLRLWLNTDGIYENGGLLCAYSYRNYVNLGIAETSVTNNTYKFDYIIFDYNKLNFNSSVDCSQDSNYLQCLEDKNTCEGLYNRLETNYELLEGNYNTCTSELSSCLENGGSSGSGDVQWSSLFINNIQHLGKPIINITFPDYLDWDYTTTDDEFNLDIVGYPVDTEYIDGIIRTQNYKPTSEDFTQLVGMLAPYSKYLLFLLFIFIIWAWIKKPFKSKKL